MIQRAMMFTDRVRTNSTRPLAIRADRPLEPASFHFSAMFAAKVLPPGSVRWTLTVKTAERIRATAMVSPSARPRPSMAAEIMPGLANGNTAMRTISHRVAPSARAASLCPSGTCTITSRLTAATVGRIMMASTIDARNRLLP